MKSKARRTIETWTDRDMTKPKPAPVALGTGVVVMYPASTVPYDYYITARYVRHTAKRSYVEYVCSCPGFRGGAECWHVKDLRAQTDELEALA